ncbi:MAG TPA: serine hydrolase [Steroidobacteraceae bacterium]|nr:serine hydrolase [Steroidobacteraceae bacterium]HVC02639.1 serine hydrolase [Steroidobacteraceae bacterium]
MTSRTLQFDGVEYPDGAASDPVALGWMRGAPPPADKRIRFEDDRFLQFPRLRWTLSHMRELVPTANVWRGCRAPSTLDAANPSIETEIDASGFTDLNGARRTWSASLEDTYTDGIVVLHRGRRVYERYFGALQPQRQHACFSITKSFAATLAAGLLHEGALDASRCVPFYLPEMADTAYGDATLRQLLDMQVGVAYSEEYADPHAEIWAYARAGGLRPRDPGRHGPANYYEFLATLRKQGEHGRSFEYKTVNTEVLCWIMKRVSGIGLADLLSQRLWSPLACEEDAYFSVDSIGVEMGGGGLNACLRDLARFGELLRREGDWQGVQLLPAAVVAELCTGSAPTKVPAAQYPLLPGYSYRNMWWIANDELGTIEARGIHGQRLFIAPRAEVVIARFASHPVATSAANDPVTLPAFRALARMLSRG